MKDVKFVVLLILIIFVGIVNVSWPEKSQKEYKTLVVRGLYVVNEDNIPLIQLSAFDKQKARIDLFDIDGQPRLTLYTLGGSRAGIEIHEYLTNTENAPTEPGIFLTTSGSEPRVTLLDTFGAVSEITANGISKKPMGTYTLYPTKDRYPIKIRGPIGEADLRN